MNISLCIYTNCTFYNSSEITLIKTSFNSFNKVFDINNFKERIIFLDKNPNIKNYNLYYNLLKEFFSQYNFQIITTNCLAEGFLYSIKNL